MLIPPNKKFNGEIPAKPIWANNLSLFKTNGNGVTVWLAMKFYVKRL